MEITKRAPRSWVRKTTGGANGVIVWEGPSLYDGQPIAVIAVGLLRKSTNDKTDDMVQFYVVPTWVSPSESVRSGEDRSVCGDCRHRGTNGVGRSCYVVLFQGPRAVFDAYSRDVYPRVTAEQTADLMEGRQCRLGAWGDPGAVPLHVWTNAVSRAAGWTGYTHAWKTRPDLAPLCMASVDTEEERAEAAAAKWRTFRVTVEGADANPAEIFCPATERGGNATNCAACGLCKGNGIKAKSIGAEAHGSGRKNYERSL